jgi:hypothetical protein
LIGAGPLLPGQQRILPPRQQSALDRLLSGAPIIPGQSSTEPVTRAAFTSPTERYAALAGRYAYAGQAAAGIDLTARQQAALAAVLPHAHPNTALHTAQLQVQAADRSWQTALKYDQSVKDQQTALDNYIAAQRKLINVQGLKGDTRSAAESSLDAYRQQAIDTIGAKFSAWLNQQRSILGKNVTLAQLSGGNVGTADAALQAFDKKYAGAQGLTGQDLRIQALENTRSQAQQQLTGLQDRVTLAGLQKNLPNERLALQSEIADIKKNATALGLTPLQAQIQVLQLQQQLKNLTVVTPGVQLIRPATAGLGQLSQGFGSSAARLSGGEADSASRMIAVLQAQVARLESALRIANDQLAQDRKNGSSLDKIERNTRPHMPPPVKGPTHYNHMRGAAV